MSSAASWAGVGLATASRIRGVGSLTYLFRSDRCVRLTSSAARGQLHVFQKYMRQELFFVCPAHSGNYSGQCTRTLSNRAIWSTLRYDLLSSGSTGAEAFRSSLTLKHVFFWHCPPRLNSPLAVVLGSVVRALVFRMFSVHLLRIRISRTHTTFCPIAALELRSKLAVRRICDCEWHFCSKVTHVVFRSNRCA
jgi:hypothetical protein